MGRRPTRSEYPGQAAEAVAALRACRTAMVRVRCEVRPTCAVADAASNVMKAIDGLATLLTGDPEYFWVKMAVSGGDGGQALREQLAREAGELPWERPTDPGKR